MAKESRNTDERVDAIKTQLNLLMAGALITTPNVVIGHPLDTVKTFAQKHNVGFLQATKTIYGKEGVFKGFSGLYKGFNPNLGRNLLNTTWRVPLTTKGPQLFADNFSMRSENGKPTDAANLCASFLFAGPVDAGLSSVFEGYKVRKQLGGEYKDVPEIFKQKTKDLKMHDVKYLKAIGSTYMKGTTQIYLKNAIGYSTLFSIKKAHDDLNQSYNPGGEYSYLTIPASAAATSVLKVGMTNPIDVIKTNVQAPGSEEGASTFSVAKKIVSQGGVKALYRGAVPRLMHGFLAANSGMYIMKLNDTVNDQLSNDSASKSKHNFISSLEKERTSKKESNELGK